MTNPESRVRWTKKALAHVLPGPENLSAARIRVPPRQALEQLGQLVIGAGERWRAGLDCQDPPLRESVQRVLASYDEPERFPLDKLDVDLEVPRAAMLDLEWEGIWDPQLHRASGDTVSDRPQVIDLALDFWEEAAGLAFALRVIVHARRLCRFSSGTGSYDAPGPLWLAPRPDLKTSRYSINPLWIALRSRISAAPQSVYKRARVDAEAMRSTVDDDTRVFLSFSFPAEQGWCREDTERILASKYDFGTPLPWLLATVRDVSLAGRLTDMCGYADDRLPYTILRNLGENAVPVLAALYTRSHGRLRKACIGAMGLIESPTAVRFFVSRLSERSVTPTATAYLERFRQWAEPELELAAEQSEAAAVLLKGFRAKSGARTKPAASPEPADSPESLPGFLKMPSWVPGYRVRPFPVLRLEPLPVESRISIVEIREDEGADEISEITMSHCDPTTVRTYLPKALEDGKTDVYEPSALQCFEREEALAIWRRAPTAFWRLKRTASVAGHLDRFGFDALPGLLECARVSPKALVPALQGVVSREVALTVARVYRGSKLGRPAARAWLAGHAGEAAICLIPAALGPKSPSRDVALGALRFLFSSGYDAVVLTEAARYGAEVASVLRQVLGRDELLEKKRRPPALPPFWAPESWSPPKLVKTGRPLPRESLDHLGEVLMLLSLDQPSPLMAKLKSVCDRASLSSFAWDLFEAWCKVGSPRKEVWAFHALGHLGDDSVVPSLASQIRTWPLEGLPGYASTGLEVLSVIGTDASLHEIQRVSQRFKSRGLKERAGRMVRQLAEVRGFTPDQLADRLVPDLGLDSDGTRVVDFGSRSFRVAFDEGLHPYVSTESGERLRELPPPGKRDDAQKARAAAETWKAMKKEVRSLRTLERRRLERALVGRRRWTTDEFRTCLVEHPLLLYLVRGLVWGLYDRGSTLVQTFRVARDRDYLDREGERLILSADVLVGLPHPIEMPPEEVERWKDVFAEFALIQPFPQLERPVIRRTPEQESLKALDWLEGHQVATTRVLGLEGRGWQREGQDGGTSSVMIKPIPGTALQAELPLDPGIFAMVSELPTQTIGRVVLGMRRRIRWGEAELVTMGALDELAFSELASDLLWLQAED